MATLGVLVGHLGGMVVQLVTAPRGLEVDLSRVVVHDPLERSEVGPGDVVLGIGASTTREVARVLKMIAPEEPAALVVKGSAADMPLEEADAAGVALLVIPAGTPWAQVVLLVSSVLSSDRFRFDDERLAGSSAGELFAVANAIADTIGAPITIEDPQSTVLAFSGRQDEADPARVETVLGRRVPEEIRHMLSERGIFRRLYSEPGPLYLEAFTPDFLPRVAIAIRAGDEVLGSIWAAVKGPLDAEQERLLVDASHLVALHLLRHLLAADAQRGLEADLVAAVLSGGSLAREASRRLDLSAPAYCVVAVGLDRPRPDRDIVLARLRHMLDLQLSAVHRAAPTAQVGGVVYAIVPAAGSHGSRTLRHLLEGFLERATAVVNVGPLVAIGREVGGLQEVPSSKQTADRVLRALGGRPGPAMAELDDVRAKALMLELASALAGDPILQGGPLARLSEHDRLHGTNHVDTLTAYLNAFGNMGVVARGLGVHTNTVRYRLRHMQLVAELRLDDPTHRLALMVELMLLGEAPA